MTSASAARGEVCAPSLVRLASHLAGGADADDLLQSALLRAVEHGVPTTRKPWLRRVLTNERNMWLRARTRRAERESRHAERPQPVDVEEVVHALELAEIVRALVAELDPPIRTVVEARYFDGQSSAEVARTLGIPAGTVRWRLKQGLDALRVRLDRRHGGRRALWAGAVLGLHKDPTVAASTASEGMMSVKILASLAALFTVGTAGAVALDRNASEAEAAQPAARVVATTKPTASQETPAAEAKPAKDVWSKRRRDIRQVLDVPRLPVAAAAAEDDYVLDGLQLAAEVSSIVDGCSEFMAETPENLQLSAHVIGAPGTGTIVEEVTLSEDTPLTQDLAECLTESMYTLDLGDVEAPFERDVDVLLDASANHVLPGGVLPEGLPPEVREAVEAALDGKENGTEQVMLLGKQGEPLDLDELPEDMHWVLDAHEHAEAAD